jgi:hypothetical protein
MKFRFSILFALIAVVMGLPLLTGCSSIKYGSAHTVRLKIVDAKTGDPLSGVSAMWRQDQDDLLYGTSHLGPTDLKPSDVKGELAIPDVREKMTGRLVLDCPGHVTMYGVYSGGSLSLSREIQPPPLPQDLFELDDPQTDDELSDGNLVVRMPK